MEKGEKDIRTSLISEKEKKQFVDTIKKIEDSVEALENQITDLYLKKKNLEEKQQGIHKQIQVADELVKKLRISKHYEDIDFVREQEEKKGRLDRELAQLILGIENLKTQISDKVEEGVYLMNVGGKDMANQDMLQSALANMLGSGLTKEKVVEEANEKFEVSKKELKETKKTLKEKKIELEEKEDKLAELKSRLFMVESSDKPDSEELKGLEKEESKQEEYIGKLKKEISELKEKILEKEKQVEKLTDDFLDMINELEKIKQQ